MKNQTNSSEKNGDKSWEKDEKKWWTLCKYLLKWKKWNKLMMKTTFETNSFY